MTKRSRKLKHKYFYMVKAVALTIFPLVLLVLPATFFDKGPAICLFTRLSGYSCWGCGLTRACMHLIHLDWAGAANYNKLSFIVLPILCGLTIEEIRRSLLLYKKASDTTS